MNAAQNMIEWFLTKNKLSTAQVLDGFELLALMKMRDLGEELIMEAFKQRENAEDINIAADAMDDFKQIGENLDKVEDAYTMAMN